MDQDYSEPLGEKETLEILNESNAVLTGGHFVLNAGEHSSVYVNKDAIFPHTVETSRLCHSLAIWFADDNVEVVAAAAKGGIAISQWTAHHLSQITDREVLSVYAERFETSILKAAADTVVTFSSLIYVLLKGQELVIKEDCFKFERGYDKLVADRRVLVVEDVLNTGGSAKKVIGSVRELGGFVIGLGAFCNRGGITKEDMDVPKLIALANIPLESWSENECARSGPCSHGIPVNTNMGKGREFLGRKKK